MSNPEIGIGFEGGHGPFSWELACAEEDAVSGGTARRTGTGSILLTAERLEAAGPLWDRMDRVTRDDVVDAKGLMNDMSYMELVSSIYSMYPEMAEGTRDREMYEKYRAEAAVSLVMKRKTSVGRSAEIAGMAQSDFIDLLYRNRITVFASSGEDVLESIRRFKAKKSKLVDTIESINRYVCVSAE